MVRIFICNLECVGIQGGVLSELFWVLVEEHSYSTMGIGRISVFTNKDGGDSGVYMFNKEKVDFLVKGGEFYFDCLNDLLL